MTNALANGATSTRSETSALRSVGAEPRWKDLYRIGGASCVVLLGLVGIAIVAFLVWSYAPRMLTTEEVFTSLQAQPLGALFSLDLMMVVTAPIVVVLNVAVYVAVKRVNESYALLSLVLAAVALPMLIPTRPLSELMYLSREYAVAATEAGRAEHLAAGGALLSLFDGTSWMMYSILTNASTVVSGLLMLRTPAFRRATAYVGVGLGITGGLIVVPVIGVPSALLNLAACPVWFVLMAGDFFRLARAASRPAAASDQASTGGAAAPSPDGRPRRKQRLRALTFGVALIVAVSSNLAGCRGDMLPRELGDPGANRNVLIAGQSTPFKENVVREVLELLGSADYHVRITGLDHLNSLDTDEYGAVVLATWYSQGKIMDQRVTDFLAIRADDPAVILLYTHGGDHPLPDSRRPAIAVDAVSSPSRQDRVLPTANELKSLVEARF